MYKMVSMFKVFTCRDQRRALCVFLLPFHFNF